VEQDFEGRDNDFSEHRSRARFYAYL
jgi:hypothetical protein